MKRKGFPMRTNEERIRAMHEWAAKMESESRRRMAGLFSSLSVAAGFIVVIFLSFYLHGVNGAVNSAFPVGGMSASIFSDSSVLGFIVIGIVAFLLGIAVTLFCMYLKKWKDEKEDLG